MAETNQRKDRGWGLIVSLLIWAAIAIIVGVTTKDAKMGEGASFVGLIWVVVMGPVFIFGGVLVDRLILTRERPGRDT